MSNCDVCIGGGEADGSFDFYRSSEPKAKKPHKCIECRKVIAVGEKHSLFVGKYDGDFSSSRACLECAEIQRAYSCGELIIVGDLWSEMRDHGFPNMRMAGECWDSLTAPAKAKLLEKWREWKGIQ